MPYGGNDWLALTQEPTLEPELPICDPHHHLWDKRTARTPYQRYLIEELTADTQAGHDVRSTVFVEARSMYRADGPDQMKPVGEVEFVQGVAAASASGIYGPSRAAAAIVGHANLLLGDRVEPVLDALQAASPNRFRGIRHTVTYDAHPEVENIAAHPEPHQLLDEEFRKGAKLLAQRGLTYDCWLYFPQMPELADLAKALPDLTIILDHIGGLQRTGPYAANADETMDVWRKGIEELAACPNVVVKVGGLGMPRNGFDWHLRDKPVGSEELAEQMAPLMHEVIEKFGPERCMFESNFPVDKVSFSHHILYNAFKRLSAGYSASERAALFHDTAARIYRIEG